jgi:hypothetical protein
MVPIPIGHMIVALSCNQKLPFGRDYLLSGVQSYAV